MLLSDAFQGRKKEMAAIPCLECRVRLLNINQGHNQELLEKCRRLWEYAELIRRVRDNQDRGMELRQAVDKAVDSCIADGILADILIRSKMEVVDMLLEEYDEKATKRYLRKEAQEEGRILTHVSMIRRKMQKGCTEAEIADALEEPTAYIRLILEWLKKYPEDCIDELHWNDMHWNELCFQIRTRSAN